MNNPYQLLLEPVPIGPVVAPNRFYQVPHCNGLGYRSPHALAAMRGMKAAGGWGVVCTEEVEIHHSSDLSPYIEGRLWDDGDLPAQRLMVESVHAHGALAGIELAHNGLNASNLYSRVPPFGPRSMSVLGGGGYNPVQTRAMDREDIRRVRRWHREAALRAKAAGFDIIYCYAGHMLTLPMQFLSRRFNDRTDEYGGSLANRVRLLRELIEETLEAVGDRCAVAVRLAVDELLGEEGITHQGEGYEIVAMLAELPDLWDVNISSWSHDSATSRFEKEGFQERYIGFVKKLTSKPVVGVGRYTTPEAMVSAVERGILDLIGAARPSIADPFLPRKIGLKTSANASAATSVSRPTPASSPFAAPRTRPWARNGGRNGIRSRSLRAGVSGTCSSSAADRPGWSAPAPWVSEGTGWCSSRGGGSWAAGSPWSRPCPGCGSGGG